MIRSHSICFYILLTNKHNLARLLCDCFSIIGRSASFETGMVYLQLGFCHKLGLPFNDLRAGGTLLRLFFQFFFQDIEPWKLLTLMSFPLKKNYLKNRQDVYMLTFIGLQWSNIATPLPRNRSPKNKETKNTCYELKTPLCQISLVG